MAIRLGIFNRRIKKYLVENHNWDDDKAYNWVIDNLDDLKIIRESGQRAEDVARRIACG